MIIGIEPHQLPASAVPQALHQGWGLRLGQGKAQGDHTAMLDTQQLSLREFDFAPDQAFEGVGHAARQLRALDQRDFVSREQGLCHRIGVGPDQSTRSEFDATKIAHHRGQHALQVLVAQHVQHGPPRGTTGFAIVIGGRLAACQQGPADVSGIRMLGLEPGYPSQRLLAPRHRLHAGDETIFLMISSWRAGAASEKGMSEE